MLVTSIFSFPKMFSVVERKFNYYVLIYIKLSFTNASNFDFSKFSLYMLKV